MMMARDYEDLHQKYRALNTSYEQLLAATGGREIQWGVDEVENSSADVCSEGSLYSGVGSMEFTGPEFGFLPFCYGLGHNFPPAFPVPERFPQLMEQ
jgi:hypothetical protein